MLNAIAEQQTTTHQAVSAKQRAVFGLLQKQLSLLRLEEALLLLSFTVSGAVGRSLLQGFPSVEPITFFAVLAGALFGRIKGAAVGASAWYFSDYLVLGGQGPWSLIHIASGAAAGFLGGVLVRRRHVIPAVVSMVAATLFFEATMNVASGFFFGFGVLVSFLSAIPFMITHFTSNIAFGLLIAPAARFIHRSGRFDQLELLRQASHHVKKRLHPGRLKMMLPLALFLFALPFVQGERVGIVVGFPDGTLHAECVDVSTNANGRTTLEKTSFDLLWAGPSQFGHSLCRINGVGDDAAGKSCSFANQKYWGFFTADSSAWSYMPVGFDGGNTCWNGNFGSFDGHYCAQDGDVLGFRYGTFGDEPPFYSFSDLCQPLKLDSVKVYVNDDRENRADETGGTIRASPNATLRFSLSLRNDYPFDKKLDVEDVEAELFLDELEDVVLPDARSFSKLREGDREKEEFSFSLPFLVREDTYPLTLRITGETSTGIMQELNVPYTLRIDKPSRGLLIPEARLDHWPSCPGDANNLLFTVINLGSNDAEDVLIRVDAPSLSFSFSDTRDLDAGDDPDDVTYTHSLPFSVPADAPSIEHEFTIDASYRDESTFATVRLPVRNCTTSSPVAQDTQPVDRTTTVSDVSLVRSSSDSPSALPSVTPVAAAAEKPFLERYASLLFLLLLDALLVLLIILIALIVRK